MNNGVTTTGLVLALVIPLGGSTAQQTGAQRNRLIISAEEIATLRSDDAFQVVEKLRPEYFRRAERNQTVQGGERIMARGPLPRVPTARTQMMPNASVLRLVVFVNGTELGDAQQLRQIRADDVQEMRYLTGPDAQIRLGPRYAGGVLEVRLKS
jgi:hypothetical protein